MNRPRVLVIDDSATARLITKNALERVGMEVALANDHIEGTRLAHLLAPDVAVLDVVLPETTGIEVCREWRTDPALQNIPVLLVSGERSGSRDRVAGLLAGAYGYLTKPFDDTEVVAQINLLYELSRTHARLREQAKIAEDANKSKSQLLANVSHEIRTPLAAMVGFADDLPSPDTTLAEFRECSEIIAQSGKHLLQILNDILDVSKIEAGRLEIERISASPLDLIQNVRQLMKQRAAEKGLDFQVRLESSIPSVVQTDPTRLKQIFFNLCSNAIKFTERGKVVLVLAYDREPQRLKFKVSDTGPGIPAEQQARLFQAFAQADASIARSHGGTGLGLTICKQLTSLMEGTIDFHSEVGKGTTFIGSVKAPCSADVQFVAGIAQTVTSEETSAAAGGVFQEPGARPGAPLTADNSLDGQSTQARTGR